VIEFCDVVKEFDGRRVLDGLSFKIAQGELFVVAGPSGSGKTVTLKLIGGLLSPSSGCVQVDGVDVGSAGRDALRGIRSRMGYLFQSGALLAWLSLFENIALPLRENTTMTEDEIEKRVMEMLEMVGLEADGAKFPAEISGGMCKRAGLARALVMKPDIVLFDEPTSGLDPVMARQIDALIRDLTSRLKMTGIVVTHDLRGALNYADRIGLLGAGTFAELATPAEFVKSQNEEVKSFLKAQFIDQKG